MSGRVRWCDGDDFDFDEPGGAADGGLGGEQGDVGVALAQGGANMGGVGGVAEIGDQVAEVGRRGAGLPEEGLDVFKGAVELAVDVADVEDLTALIDAGGAGDDDVLAVAVGNGCAAFKSYAVGVGCAELLGGTEMTDLCRLEAGDGVGVEGESGFGRQAGGFDARAGDVVGLGREAVLFEELAAGGGHGGVVGVDVAEEEPGALDVIGEVQVAVAQLVVVSGKDGGGLVGDVCVAGVQ